MSMSFMQMRVGPTAGEDTQPWKDMGSIRKKSAGRASDMPGFVRCRVCVLPCLRVLDTYCLRRGVFFFWQGPGKTGPLFEEKGAAFFFLFFSIKGRTNGCRGGRPILGVLAAPAGVFKAMSTGPPTRLQ